MRGWRRVLRPPLSDSLAITGGEAPSRRRPSRKKKSAPRLPPSFDRRVKSLRKSWQADSGPRRLRPASPSCPSWTSHVRRTCMGQPERLLTLSQAHSTSWCTPMQNQPRPLNGRWLPACFSHACSHPCTQGGERPPAGRGGGVSAAAQLLNACAQGGYVRGLQRRHGGGLVTVCAPELAAGASDRASGERTVGWIGWCNQPTDDRRRARAPGQRAAAAGRPSDRATVFLPLRNPQGPARWVVVRTGTRSRTSLAGERCIS